MKSKSLLQKFSETPISFSYPKPSSNFVEDLVKDQQLVVLKASQNLFLDQTYFKAGHAGCSPYTFTRKAVAKRIEQALEILMPDYGLLIFDAYRSKVAQRALFKHMANEISEKNPSWVEEKIFNETCKYMVHPDDKSRFPIAPHNSGGAIDLALHKDGKLLKFGSNFDDPLKESSTRFFEADYNSQSQFSPEEWNRFRILRRILFHTMASLGFTNYQDEWWHYDLGDCMWALEFNWKWVFDSLEADVDRYERDVQS
jgi:zinc D-Ala-D-Ala dipeptidase